MYVFTIKPTFPTELGNLGIALVAANNTQEAINTFRKYDIENCRYEFFKCRADYFPALTSSVEKPAVLYDGLGAISYGTRP